jgi:hypothetical protein
MEKQKKGGLTLDGRSPQDKYALPEEADFPFLDFPRVKVS